MEFISSTFIENKGSVANILFAYQNSLGYTKFESCLFEGEIDLDYDANKFSSLSFDTLDKSKGVSMFNLFKPFFI